MIIGGSNWRRKLLSISQLSFLLLCLLSLAFLAFLLSESSGDTINKSQNSLTEQKTCRALKPISNGLSVKLKEDD